MEIHVARNSSSLGAFSTEEVRAGLANGRFVTSDLAWREGMAAWSPLGDWPEFKGAVPPPSPGLPAATSGELPVLPSWERGASFANFFSTIKEVALDPVRTFDGLRDGGFGRPITFSYAASFPAWLCGSALYSGLIFFMFSLSREAGAADANDPVLQFLSEYGAGAASAIISGGLGCLFLLAPLFSFVGAAFVHLLLLPWNPQGGYAQTYRAQAYAYNAFLPFAFIPCVNYVVMPWQLVAAVIAHSRVHRIAWWKVAISIVLIPCLLGCAVYAALFAAMMKA